MSSDISKGEIRENRTPYECISLFLIQKTPCKNLFPHCVFVYAFVGLYLQFYVICIPLQAGSCIMHQIHSSYYFMVCNFPLQYNKSDCNSDIFNNKLDTLLLPLFFSPLFIYLNTDHIKLVLK